MGGSQTNTSTTSNASTDPNVTTTVDQLLKGVQGAYAAGPQVFNQSLYSPSGATTQAGQAGALSAANNPTYASGVAKGIGYDSSLAGGSGPSLTEKTLGGVAAGNYLDGSQDPGYQALRAKAGNDAQTLINGQFNNSGRLGGGSNALAVGQGVTNAFANLDYTNYQNEIQRQQQALSSIEGTRQQGVNNAVTAQNQLPSLYQSSLAPSATQGAVGAAQDANTQATLLGQNDLFQRNANSKTDLLAKLSSILAGTSPSAGQTSTTSSPAPQWWQSALGLAGSLL